MLSVRCRFLGGLLVLALACCLPASADVFFNNLDLPSAASSGNDFGGLYLWNAQRFTAGANASVANWWAFSSDGGSSWFSATNGFANQMEVEADVDGDGTTSSPIVTVALSTGPNLPATNAFSFAIYSDSLSPNPDFGLYRPGVSIGTLTMTKKQLNPDGTIEGVSFKPDEDTEITLNAGTSYWVVLDGNAPDGEVLWSYADVPEYLGDSVPTPEPGPLALMAGMLGVLGITWAAAEKRQIRKREVSRQFD